MYILGKSRALPPAHTQQQLLRPALYYTSQELRSTLSDFHSKMSMSIRRFFFRSIARSRYYGSKKSLVVSPEVSEAIRTGKAVVALESTIISHGGLPYPRNLALARDAEALIRSFGAVPATCAVIGGVPKVGLSLSDLEFLSSSGSKGGVTKASRRDLSIIMAKGSHASTTVAATMVLAAQAGINVFATGGIGGVHRGAEQSLDISADLSELGRTPVAVVCAGVKSILDIPKTLEVLETQGVPVIGFNTSTFPAFFVNSTGNPPIPVPLRLDSTADVAKAIHSSLSLGLSNGIVVAVPNPHPHPDPASLEH